MSGTVLSPRCRTKSDHGAVGTFSLVTGPTFGLTPSSLLYTEDTHFQERDGQLGVQIHLGAKVKGYKKYKQYRWVQKIKTNDPRPGKPANEWYFDHDPRDPDQNTPFYYTEEQEANASVNNTVYSNVFVDRPSRPSFHAKLRGPIVWQAELSLVGVATPWERDTQYTPIAVLTYGFTIAVNTEGNPTIAKDPLIRVK